MPKHEAMAQLSRPFQIALVAVLLFAGVWLFALQGRSTSTGGAGSSAVVSTTAPAAPVAHKPAGTTSKAASSRTSSTRAATHRLSTSATHSSVRHATQTAPSAPVKTATKAPTKTAVKAPAKTTTKAQASPAHNATGAPSAAMIGGQHTVEADLAKGDVVVLLFWNPSGADDATVHQAVQSVKKLNRVAVQEAGASQVASFGSVTRGVQVYATPTIFVIGAHRQAIVLTGVQDAFSLEQAIAEARSS